MLDELIHGHDLDHLVSTRLHPNRVAVGFRLLARNLAIGSQIHDAGERPARIHEPLAFRATQVTGLGIFVVHERHIAVLPYAPLAPKPPGQLLCWQLPWTQRTVRLVA